MKTLDKQKKSLKNILKVDKTKLIPYSPTEELLDENFNSPTEELLDENFIGKAILECLKNNDSEGVMEVISIYFNTLNKALTK